MTTLSKYRRTAASAGFTLVELLVVVAAVSILLTLGSVGIKSLTGGKGTTAGLATMEVLVEEARQTGIKNGGFGYLVIPAEQVPQTDDRFTQAKKNYLRQVYIGLGEVDPQTGNEGQVELISRPNELPADTYFNPKLSNKGTGVYNFTKTKIKVPRAGNTNGREDCYILRFNSKGFLAPRQGSADLAKIVLSRAVLNNSYQLQMEKSAANDHTAMAVWKTGRTTLIREMAKIEPSATSSNSAPNRYDTN